MSYQHPTLAAGRWKDFSLTEQMANVGSEVFRAMNWKKKENSEYSRLAAVRALELLWLSIDDPKNRHGVRELTRGYEFLVDYFFGDNIYHTTETQLTNYYMAFTYAARKDR